LAYLVLSGAGYGIGFALTGYPQTGVVGALLGLVIGRLGLVLLAYRGVLSKRLKAEDRVHPE
jgi:hypothetical protein